MATGEVFNSEIITGISDQLEETIATFETLTGLRICFLFSGTRENESGYRETNFLRRYGHRNDFCTLIKSAPDTRSCGYYDRHGRIAEAANRDLPFIDECPAGVVEVVLPLYIHGRFVGAYFCGQFATHSDREKGFGEIWSKVGKRGIDREKLRAAYANFKFCSKGEALALGRLLHNAISHVAGSLEDTLTERTIRLKQNPIIQKALLMIFNSSGSLPSETELANRLDITPEYFSRLFRKVMKKSYRQYITEMRISKAQELLRYTDLSVMDIALEVGYQTHSFFTHKFHRITGITPTKYRASHGNLVKPRRSVR
ncbi:MAG: helix-turn-helix domain-containing protein [Spirochaetaceae bacterium]|nr:MAG: helix-turn-helix domain-containing protein [Spirochaetaceae bacterium]